MSGLSRALDARDLAVSVAARTYVFWGLHPLIANGLSFGISAFTLYQFFTDQEFQNFVFSQPNPAGFAEAEVSALFRSARNLKRLAEGAGAALKDSATVRGILQKANLGIDRTLAFGTLQIDGASGITRIANSGPSVSGTVPEVSDPRYSSQRLQDAEQKLLEYFGGNLRPGATGTLELAVDHSEGPCDQCSSVLQQFKKDFPGIQVVVHYLTPAPGLLDPWMKLMVR